jgi:hypothetical protein
MRDIAHRRRKGQGCIYMRKGKWHAVSPRVNGKVQRLPGTFCTHREAERALEAFTELHKAE